MAMTAAHMPDREPSHDLPTDSPTSRAGPLATSPFAAFGCLIALAGLFNVLCLPVIASSHPDDGRWVWLAITVGIWAGQLGVATLWLVWSPGPFVRRLVVHWTVGLGLYACWALGYAAAFGSDGPPGHVPEAWWFVLSGLPAVSLAAQLPLWPLRTHFGWRIERPDSASQSGPAQSLSIRDMILATLLTSVSLAALRLTPWAVNRPPDAEYWAGWAIALLSIAGASAVTLVPAVRLALRVRDWALAIEVLLGVAGAAWLGTLVVATAVVGTPPAEAVIAMGIAYASFAGALAVPLLIVKGRGYQLTFAGERARRTDF
jgi:hypothetical protein